MARKEKVGRGKKGKVEEPEVAETPREPAKPDKPPRRELAPAQKAAAVIVALGTDKASILYQHMDPDEIEQVTIEVAKLGFVDAETTQDVLNEYYQMCMMNKAVTEGGLE